jgi:lipoprotein-anchoring transpeptidase ErfK/SrfK
MLLKKIKLSLIKHKTIAVIFLSTLIFCFSASGLVFGYEKLYTQKIYQGVKINGWDVSNKSLSDAGSLVGNKVTKINNSSISIINEDKSKQVVFSDLSLNIDINSALDSAYNIGRNGNLFNKLKEQAIALFNAKNVSLTLNYDTNKLTDTVNTITKDYVKPMKNAELNVSNNNLYITQEEYGQSVDVNKFIEDSLNYINGGSNKISLTINNTTPDITQSQVELVKNKISSIVFPEIVLIDEGANNQFVAHASDIVKWVTLNKVDNNQLSVDLSTDNVKSFISTLSKQVNKKPVDRRINKTSGAIIVEGSDGENLDVNKTTESVISMLNDRKIDKSNLTNIKLAVSTVKKSDKFEYTWDGNVTGGSPGLMEGKYVEVNIGEQKMYLYNGTNLEGAYTVSTGKPGMDTPIGTRYILGKSDRAWSAKYKLYMPFWEDLGGGYGIHELPEWPNGYKEGEAHLGIKVSHGCIRLGQGAAETVYRWTDIGTPIIIHE